MRITLHTIDPPDYDGYFHTLVVALSEKSMFAVRTLEPRKCTEKQLARALSRSFKSLAKGIYQHYKGSK